MGTSLSGLTPQNTYAGLLKFGDNSAISASLKAISDGAGNDTMIQLSTTALQIGGSTGMYWDNTNKRLGVGTNAPNTNLEVYSGAGGYIVHNASSGYNGFSGFRCLVQGGIRGYMELNPNTGEFKVGADGSGYFLTLGAGGVERMRVTTTGTIVKGSGSTSATTSLLVQNSVGNNALQIRDDRVIIMAGLPTSSSGLPTGALWNNLGVLSVA